MRLRFYKYYGLRFQRLSHTDSSGPKQVISEGDPIQAKEAIRMLLEMWKPRVASLSRWDPFAEMAGLHREMDQVFGEFFGQTPFSMAETEAMWSPLVDVHETKDNLLLQVEVPGVKQEDIQVSIEGDTLTLKGERKREAEVKEDEYHRIERSYGRFERNILLPSLVDPNRVKATYRDGVLEIQLAKKEEAKPKEIKVEVA
jgi:HSP20 family protein